MQPNHARYQIKQLLGQSHLSRTYLAIDLEGDTQTATPQLCVIKQLQISHQAERIQAAIHRLKAIEHPQLPAFLDAFQQDDCFYYIQEYIEGVTLAKQLVEQGRFTVTAVWQVLESLLPVLRYLHQQGSIHADIKPENIICRSAEKPDALALVDLTATELINLTGSPEYAAPEQVKGQPEFASDLFSLGMTCIHLLTGLRPFQLPSESPLAWHQIFSQISPQAENAEPLLQFLDRLTARSFDQRYASAADAIAALERIRGRKLPPEPAINSTSTEPIWQCLATLSGHQGLFASVNAVAANSHLIASASDDKTIRLWNLSDYQECGKLSAHTGFVKTVAFHPHQPQLASGSHDRTIKLWHWQTQQLQHSLTGHSNAVNTVAFSPDGKLLVSGSSDKTIKLWESAGTCLTTLTGHLLAVNAIAFCPTKPTLLASASTDTTIRLWNIATGELLQTLRQHTQAVRSVAFSPAGDYLASGGEDKTICLWNWHTAACRQLSGHPWPVTALLFSPDGQQLISSSWDQTIKFWQVESGKEIATLSGHSDSVNSIALIPDRELLVSSSRDKMVRIWDIHLLLARSHL